jgi:hypothetical protein
MDSEAASQWIAANGSSLSDDNASVLAETYVRNLISSGNLQMAEEWALRVTD